MMRVTVRNQRKPRLMKLDTEKMIADKEGPVGWMTFNNPARRNALSIEMRRAIPVILNAFANDPEVRVVVMRGAGDRAFVSGADISEFEEKRADPEAIAEFDRLGEKVAEAFTALEKPLVAMIRGFCIGGGLLTALKADIRVASEDSVFGVPAARLGLGYGYSGVETLAKLVGPANAAEILLTGRRFTAEEAYDMGLVNRIVTVDKLQETVAGIAAAIGENAPLTLRSLKVSLRETQKNPDQRNLERCDRLVTECFASQDYIEGRRAFMEKRRPAFRGR